MTPFRFSMFFVFFSLSLLGIGLFGVAQAQESRPEIEVNTTVLGELEDYKPPPMFGTPERPVLSRPIEKLALPFRGEDKKGLSKLKDAVQTRKVTLSHPIIEPPRRVAARTPPDTAPDAPLPKEKPEDKRVAPVPSAKPQVVKSLARATQTPSPKRPAPPARPLSESGNERNLMPALPPESVSKEPLAGSVPSPSEETLLSTPEKKFSSYGQDMPDIAPSAGQMDITEYDSPKQNKTLVSADISASSVLKPLGRKTTLPVAAPILHPEKRTTKPEIFNRESLTFKQGQSDLETDQADRIEKEIAFVLKKNKGSRLQIQSFASPADDSQSSARRVSLLRALSVRAYLVSHGIEPARIDVRALGQDGKGSTPDRVDMIVFDPSNAP